MSEAKEELKGAQFLRLKEGDTNFDLVEVKLHQHFLRTVSVRKAEVKLYDLSLISDARSQKLPLMTTHQVEQVKSQIGAVDRLEEHVMCVVYRTELKWHYIVRPTLYFFFGAKTLVQQWIDAINKRCIFKDFLHIPLLTQLEKMHEQVKLTSANNKDLPIDLFLKILGADSKRKNRVVESLRKIGFDIANRGLNIEKFSFPLFFKLYLALTRGRSDILQSVASPEKPVLEKKEFQHFINSTQRDPRLNTLIYPPLGVRKVTKIISDCDHKKDSDTISFDGLVKYLMSQDNLEIDTSQFDHLQDMDKPLSHYFINSSHNTYLEGRQMMALGSVEMYIQCLLLGCRCIELDCWDDINDEPVITHGGAFVNKLNFEEVIKSIAQYAFVVTEYPLILSFENRSKNPIVQDKMTQYCKKHFGDMLLDIPLDSHPLEENVFLPSPNMLRRKILIKNKRLLPPERTRFQSVSETPEAAALTKDRLSTALRSVAKVPQEYEGLKELDEEMAIFEPKGSSLVDKLVNYVQASKFVSFEESFEKNLSYEMFSFSESKAYGFIMNQHKLFTMYNKYQISRIYPYWKRFNSDNLMPQVFWNVGCQMVALNFQTPDLAIMLNHAKFEYNNRSGYIVKPPCLHLNRHEPFNTFAQVSIPYVVPASFELRVLSAQFVRPDVNSKIFVAVEIYGLPVDTVRNDASWNTNAVQNNFLVEFDPELWFKAGRILLPEMTMVKFTLYEEGSKVLAHRTLSFQGLQTGFRHILLREKNLHPMGISSLFVQLKIDDFVPPEAEATVQNLVSPQIKEKRTSSIGEDELFRMNSLQIMMTSRENRGLDMEIAEEGMKSAPKQVNVDIILTLQTQRKLPPTLEELMQRSHFIEPLKRTEIGENKNSKSLEAKLIKEVFHLNKAQLAEREKYKKYLLKELNKYAKEARKSVQKLGARLTELGMEQELESRVKVREFELDEQMKQKEEGFTRAEEALQNSHTVKRTSLAITELRAIHQDQVKAVRRNFAEEERSMIAELSEEEKALKRSGEANLDKKGVARIRMEIKEMMIVKRKKSVPQMHRIQKLELDRLVEAQVRYIQSLEKEVADLKEKLAGISS